MMFKAPKSWPAAAIALHSAAAARPAPKRWPGKFGQFVKWKSCLRAARVPRIRSDDDKTHTPDACPGFQGQTGRGIGPRTTKDLIEEQLFATRRTLFNDVGLAIFDTTSLYF